MKVLKKLCAVSVLGSVALTANAGVIPFGIQSNVADSTVSSWGWSECSRSKSSALSSYADIFSSCNGDYLMMGIWNTADQNYSILGAGDFGTVTNVTYDDYRSDDNGTTLNNWSNGLNWYRTAQNGSWGFTTNNVTELNTADIFLLNGLQSQNGQTESTPSAGLSFHSGIDGLTSGWAFNTDGSSFTGMNGSTHERVFFVMDNNANVSEPGTIALLGLGLAGLGFARRKQA